MISVKNILRRKAEGGSPDRSRLVETRIAARTSPLIGRTIAFVVGETAIRMATVRHLGWRRTVLDVREQPVPADEADGAVRRQAIQKTIGEYLKTFGHRGTQVRVAVSGQETAFRTFLMPVLKHSDLKAAVQIEAARQLPFPLTECNIDFRPAFKLESSGQSRYKVALYAATQRRIRQVLQPFDDLKVTVGSVCHSHEVVGKILPSLPDYDPVQAYTVLTIGSQSSEIAFYHGSTLEFYHHTNTGGKLAGDLSDPTRRSFFVETLSTDIQTSFDYFAGQRATSSTPIIHLCGQLAGNEAFVAELQERTGLICQRFPIESLKGIQFANENAKAEAVVFLPVVAAALNSRRVADLLPIQDRIAVRNRRIDLFGRAAVAA
ncbi:MAG: pilus assembly protein PilM, partial [Bacteroidetes bacterium]|nr:pilus assembly protein PilM [Bacteroidota bacterium]